MSNLGCFSEDALAAYEELVRKEFKEKKTKGGQGSEYADNLGVGPVDHSFLDADESINKDDYSEWDFARCVRGDGSFYGIADGKKCRKGTETKAVAVKKTGKQKQREKIQKRGEATLKRATAERVLEDLQKEGKRAKQADERRRKKDGFARNRPEAIQVLVGKAQRTIDRLVARRKRMKDGSEMGNELDSRIRRLRNLMDRLQKEKGRLTGR